MCARLRLRIAAPLVPSSVSDAGTNGQIFEDYGTNQFLSYLDKFDRSKGFLIITIRAYQENRVRSEIGGSKWVKNKLQK